MQTRIPTASRRQARSLPRNQRLVLDTLRQERGARTAYELLESLRDEGFRAPLTVYRALEGLREKGLVHRIESIKAFVACCEADHHDERPAFALCARCGSVVEIEDPEMMSRLEAICARSGFTLQRAMIELSGICGPCAGTGKAS
jgi:Fur family zinc uptake transcriptional regulator